VKLFASYIESVIVFVFIVECLRVTVAVSAVSPLQQYKPSY